MIGIAPAIIYNSCSSQPAVSYKSMATVHSSEKTREYRKPHSGKTLAVSVLLLVLVGILIGSMFTALISLTKYIADPLNKLPAITFWLLGSFASITPRDVWVAGIPIAVGGIPL